MLYRIALWRIIAARLRARGRVHGLSAFDSRKGLFCVKNEVFSRLLHPLTDYGMYADLST
jgi:hypothetical protein